HPCKPAANLVGAARRGVGGDDDRIGLDLGPFDVLDLPDRSDGVLPRAMHLPRTDRGDPRRCSPHVDPSLACQSTRLFPARDVSSLVTGSVTIAGAWTAR